MRDAANFAGELADNILRRVYGYGYDINTLFPVWNAHAAENVGGVFVEYGVNRVHSLRIFNNNSDNGNSCFQILFSPFKTRKNKKG